MSCAPTPEETEIVTMLADVWNKFLTLPVEHPCDRQEFCADIHRLQDKILSRPARRGMMPGRAF